MSVRESEAGGRWCPFSRVRWAHPDGEVGWRTQHGDGSFNRVLLRPGKTEVSAGTCIASKCMAWRTTGTTEVRKGLEMIGLTHTRQVSYRERVGCCGLAGSPGLTDGEALS